MTVAERSLTSCVWVRFLIGSHTMPGLRHISLLRLRRVKSVCVFRCNLLLAFENDRVSFSIELWLPHSGQPVWRSLHLPDHLFSRPSGIDLWLPHSGQPVWSSLHLPDHLFSRPSGIDLWLPHSGQPVWRSLHLPDHLLSRPSGIDLWLPHSGQPVWRSIHLPDHLFSRPSGIDLWLPHSGQPVWSSLHLPDHLLLQSSFSIDLWPPHSGQPVWRSLHLSDHLFCRPSGIDLWPPHSGQPVWRSLPNRLLLQTSSGSGLRLWCPCVPPTWTGSAAVVAFSSQARIMGKGEERFNESFPACSLPPPPPHKWR